MGALLLTGIFLAVILALLYVYLSWNFGYWKKRGIAGPKPTILYGTMPNSITQKRNMVFDYVDLYKKFKGVEDLIGNFVLRSPSLMVLTPQLAKEVFVTKFRNFQDNSFSEFFDSTHDSILGLNPFMLKGQVWKDKRAEITPGLTANRIKASYPVTEKVTSNLVDYIKSKNEAEGKNHVFECKELMQRFAIQNVADSVYGVDAGALDVSNDSVLLRQAKKMISDLFHNVLTFSIIYSIPLLTKIWRIKFLAPDVEQFFIKLMQDAIKLRKNSNQADRVDFLNYLMQLKEKKGLSEVELQAHSITFFLDGFETSATVLAHAILCLGRNKDVQSQLRDEIEQNSNEDGTINFDKLHELKYLDQCFNETLRMFPPGSVAERVCTETTQLVDTKGKSYTIEKGTPVAVPIYCFHTDEDFFPQPDKFDPNRFSEANGGEKKYREMGAFFPFGDGPRICLGQKFATTQVKSVLAELVRNFEINVSEKTRKDLVFDPKNIILYLDGGIWCTFTELKN